MIHMDGLWYRVKLDAAWCVLFAVLLLDYRITYDTRDKVILQVEEVQRSDMP